MLRELRRRLDRLHWEGPLSVVVPCAAALLLAALFIHILSGRLMPVLESAASSRATDLMTEAVAGAVDDCLSASGMGYDDFVTVETGPDGRVTLLTANTAATNRFRRQVVEAVSERLNALDAEELGVPLGSLTGQLFLSGVGPTVRVRVWSVGSVTADYANTFTAAGVNQTRHQVVLDITAAVELFLPGKVLPVTVQNAVCVAETVIVGETPDTYLNLDQRSG